MTYQATIRFEEATDIGDNQFLVFQLNAAGPEVAHQATKRRWKKIRQQLPNATAPRLIQLKAIPISCPRCGVTELSFCHHPK